MIRDIVNACYWPGPCCSANVVVPDTMCDTAFQIDHGFPNAAAGGCSVSSGPFDYRQTDIEMDSLMQTIQENPNFYDSATFLPPSLPMTTLQGGGYEDNYGVNEQPRMFTTEYAYNQKYPPTTQTPVGSPDPAAQGQVPAQFEEFSLATQLPRLNDYNGAYIVPDTTPAMVDSTKFQSFEPYSAQYFFTTPPDTPPNMYPPLQQLPAQPTTCVRQPASSDPDPTPTIRKLLQQKKKRIAAVPCHINSVCTTCHTRTTSLWRRNHLGEIECNACNLYFRKNNCKRPVTLRKDEIMKRKRKPRLESTQSSSTTAMTSTSMDIKPELFA
uniref:Zinc finger domain containing protein n=2 Tax=Haemonchus contortus TaxID=6289 RepID=W6N9L9_HAECO